MSEGNTERLAERVAELRAEVDRLELLTASINQTMGRMVVRGLVNAIVFLPLLGIVVYVSARLALRRKK